MRIPFPPSRSSTSSSRYLLRLCLIGLAGLTALMGTTPAIAQPRLTLRPLRIAAAADLQPVLPHILNQFEQQTGLHAEASYQSSATLTAQMLNGAPFDLFLSADLSYPRRIVAAGLAASSAPIPYARGTLVLFTRRDSPLGKRWPAPTLQTLRNPALQRLAIANPDHAPYGRAALAALASLKLIDALKPRLVTAENIAQAAQFAETGNADAGLISLTAALTPALRAAGSYFVIPRDLYPPIDQGAVVLAKSPQRQNAQRLLDFLLSPPIQRQFVQSGLEPAR